MADKEKKKYLHEIEGMHEHEGVLYLPSTPVEHMDVIRQLELTSRDVIVASFSKSGTTWMQEITYLVHNQADTEKAGQLPIQKRVPFIDYDAMLPLITNGTPPRLIKTHMQPQFFKQQIQVNKTKVIVIMRNPKDTLVSFYHFYQINRAFGCFQGTWHEFFELVRNKQLVYGDWFDFTLGWWAQRHNPNVLLLKYEELKQDPLAQIRKVAEFCQQDLTEAQLQKIVEHTSFDAMKKNTSVNYTKREDFLDTRKSSFMRKGSVGDWKNYFTVNQNEYFDEMYKRRMAESGLDFTFEL